MTVVKIYFGHSLGSFLDTFLEVLFYLLSGSSRFRMPPTPLHGCCLQLVVLLLSFSSLPLYRFHGYTHLILIHLIPNHHIIPAAVPARAAISTLDECDLLRVFHANTERASMNKHIVPPVSSCFQADQLIFFLWLIDLNRTSQPNF